MNFKLNKPGDQYGCFKLEQRHVIDELKVVMNVLEHTGSKSKILHIEADDPENLFCLSFQTLPSSSNGAAHILEHTVLCGSDKYPVKDPFFAMQKRSLNTFMNALTGSDFTCYPAASLNHKDFYNLLEVYIDAVFHPKILENSFLQEGHRLEFATRDDPSTPLEIKGIVYNEMKGSMASGDSRLWHTMLKHLTPDLPYCYNSGGDPQDILTLTYKELLDFYHTYYHPSRCLFYFYGNMPLKDHLDFLEEKILHSVTPVSPLKPISQQKPFYEPKRVHMEIPGPKTSTESAEDVVGFGFLTASIENQLDVLALTLLDSYLMDTDTSKLKKALLDSDLCDNIDSYIDPEMSQMPYIIFCRGTNHEDAQNLKTIIRATLETIAKQGISKADLYPSLHQLELSRTEIGGDGQPFGLTLFMRSALNFQHGVSPEKGLIVHALFEELSVKLEDPQFMSRLIEKYLLNNPTSVELIAKASSDLLEQEAQQEKEFLASLKKSLTPQQVSHIIEKAKELNAFQKQQEHQDIECLPKIHLSDVDPQIKRYQLMPLSKGLYGFESFTNGMFYADAVLSLSHLNEKQLSLVPLLAAFMTEVGHKDQNYEKTLSDMHTYTGGISASCGLYTPVTEPDKVIPILLVKGKALNRNKEPFLELLYKMIYHPRFDELKRLEELVNQLYASMQNKLAKHAMRYASQLALSTISKAGKLNNLFYGLPLYQKVRALKQGGKDAIKSLSEELKTLYETWKLSHLIELVVVSDQDVVKKTQSFIETLFSNLTPFSANGIDLDFHEEIKQEAHIIPTAVAFNVMASKAPYYTQPESAHLMLAASVMENVFLHSKIREIGGAYGVGANCSPSSGIFYFHSYRDPHIARTFNAFKEASSYLCQGGFSMKELEEAKICIMQHIDTPLSSLAKAITAYTYLKEGRTDSLRQSFRTHLLNGSMNAVIEATKNYVLQNKHTSYISFCGSDVYKKDENLLKTSDLTLAVIPL
jgi:Zn-dependent M16 (insulinase) family peptidase